MKIVCLSDTHNAHRNLGEIPNGDILIFAGDICASWDINKQWGQIKDFNDWLGTLPYKRKIVIAGNHDKVLETSPFNNMKKELFNNCNYLEDEAIEIEGIKIYGSPMSGINGNQWAFTEHNYLRRAVDNIPAGVDILITHAPPIGILDCSPYKIFPGVEELKEKIFEVKPKYHIFGHIHEGYGREEIKGTTFLNVAMQDERGIMIEDGKRIREPIIIEL